MKKSSATPVRTHKEWLAIFEEDGLQVERKRRVHKIGYPVKRWEYVLEQPIMI